ncbi:hypothetical protein Tco_0307079 [Tanacetum coccineum]
MGSRECTTCHVQLHEDIAAKDQIWAQEKGTCRVSHELLKREDATSAETSASAVEAIGTYQLVLSYGLVIVLEQLLYAPLSLEVFISVYTVCLKMDSINCFDDKHRYFSFIRIITRIVSDMEIATSLLSLPFQSLWYPRNNMIFFLSPSVNKVFVARNVSSPMLNVVAKWLFKKRMTWMVQLHLKARLVAQGLHSNLWGSEYDETCSLVADIRAIRML